MVQTSRSGETKTSQNPSFPAIDVQRGHSYGASNNNNNNNGPVDRRTSKFKDYPSERNSLKAKRRRRRQSTASSGSSSSSGGSDDSSSLPEAPNGGWGWAVVVASFIVHLIADGCSFSFGVIYAELLDYFDESKSKTAWVGSLFISIPMLAGPIASAATNRYGCRATTIVGGFLAGLGFVLSFFAPSIEVLCVTFGLISGFGLALVYVPAVVIVAYYFEERRAFATGVAVAGSGIGTFLFAPLTDLLIEAYGGWRGAVLVLGGVMMNISVCGMIFRSLEDDDDSDSESGDSSSDDETTSSGKAAHRSHTGQSLEAFSRWSSYAARINEPNARHDEERHRHVSGRSNGGEAGDCVTFQLDPEVEQMLEEPVSQSLVLFPTYLQGEINVMSGDVIKELKESGKTLRDILTDHNLLQLLYERHTLDELMASVAESLNRSHEAVNLDLGPEEEECLDGDPGATFNRPVTMSECEDPSTSVARGSNLTQGGRRLEQRKRRNTHRQHVRMRVVHPLNRKDIFYRGNVRKDIFYRRNLRSVFNVRPPMARAASCPDVIVHVAASDVSEEGRCGLLQLSHEVKQIMSEMLDISILKTFSFLYFCASCMLLYSAYDVPYVYAPDTVSEMFSTKLASYVLSIIGIASTIGQILIGYIGDLPDVNTMHLYNFCVSMAGLCTCFVPLLTQYWMFCVYGALYGLFISANYSLTTIIIVNLFGMSKLTNAYGIINMAQGAANLVGPPLAGYIADVTDSYDLAFYLAGITMIVSGLMLFAVPCIKKYDPKSRLASRVTSAHELQSVASRRGSAPVVSGASAAPNAVAMVTDGKVTDQAPPSPSPSR